MYIFFCYIIVGDNMSSKNGSKYEYNSYKEEKKNTKSTSKYVVQKDKENTYKYYYYEENEKDKYKDINDNLNLEKKLEVERNYNYFQIILITIIYILLYISSYTGFLLELLTIFVIPSLISLMIISFVTARYCFSNIYITKWFLVPFVLSSLYMPFIVYLLYIVFKFFSSIASM